MALANMGHPPAGWLQAQGQMFSPPTATVSGTFTANPVGPTGFDVSVQLTGVIVLLLIIGVVVMARKWPVP